MIKRLLGQGLEILKVNTVIGARYSEATESMTDRS